MNPLIILNRALIHVATNPDNIMGSLFKKDANDAMNILDAAIVAVYREHDEELKKLAG